MTDKLLKKVLGEKSETQILDLAKLQTKSDPVEIPVRPLMQRNKDVRYQVEVMKQPIRLVIENFTLDAINKSDKNKDPILGYQVVSGEILYNLPDDLWKKFFEEASPEETCLWFDYEGGKEKLCNDVQKQINSGKRILGIVENIITRYAEKAGKGPFAVDDKEFLKAEFKLVSLLLPYIQKEYYAEKADIRMLQTWAESMLAQDRKLGQDSSPRQPERQCVGKANASAQPPTLEVTLPPVETRDCEDFISLDAKEGQQRLRKEVLSEISKGSKGIITIIADIAKRLGRGPADQKAHEQAMNKILSLLDPEIQKAYMEARGRDMLLQIQSEDLMSEPGKLDRHVNACLASGLSIRQAIDKVVSHNIRRIGADSRDSFIEKGELYSVLGILSDNLQKSYYEEGSKGMPSLPSNKVEIWYNILKKVDHNIHILKAISDTAQERMTNAKLPPSPQNPIPLIYNTISLISGDMRKEYADEAARRCHLAIWARDAWVPTESAPQPAGQQVEDQPMEGDRDDSQLTLKDLYRELPLAENKIDLHIERDKLEKHVKWRQRDSRSVTEIVEDIAKCAVKDRENILRPRAISREVMSILVTSPWIRQEQLLEKAEGSRDIPLPWEERPSLNSKRGKELLCKQVRLSLSTGINPVSQILWQIITASMKQSDVPSLSTKEYEKIACKMLSLLPPKVQEEYYKENLSCIRLQESFHDHMDEFIRLRRDAGQSVPQTVSDLVDRNIYLAGASHNTSRVQDTYSILSQRSSETQQHFWEETSRESKPLLNRKEEKWKLWESIHKQLGSGSTINTSICFNARNLLDLGPDADVPLGEIGKLVSLLPPSLQTEFSGEGSRHWCLKSLAKTPDSWQAFLQSGETELPVGEGDGLSQPTLEQCYRKITLKENKVDLQIQRELLDQYVRSQLKAGHSIEVILPAMAAHATKLLENASPLGRQRETLRILKTSSFIRGAHLSPRSKGAPEMFFQKEGKGLPLESMEEKEYLSEQVRSRLAGGLTINKVVYDITKESMELDINSTEGAKAWDKTLLLLHPEIQKAFFEEQFAQVNRKIQSADLLDAITVLKELDEERSIVSVIDEIALQDAEKSGVRLLGDSIHTREIAKLVQRLPYVQQRMYEEEKEAQKDLLIHCMVDIPDEESQLVLSSLNLSTSQMVLGIYIHPCVFVLQDATVNSVQSRLDKGEPLPKIVLSIAQGVDQILGRTISDQSVHAQGISKLLSMLSPEQREAYHIARKEMIERARKQVERVHKEIDKNIDTWVYKDYLIKAFALFHSTKDVLPTQEELEKKQTDFLDESIQKMEKIIEQKKSLIRECNRTINNKNDYDSNAFKIVAAQLGILNFILASDQKKIEQNVLESARVKGRVDGMSVGLSATLTEPTRENRRRFQVALHSVQPYVEALRHGSNQLDNSSPDPVRQDCQEKSPDSEPCLRSRDQALCEKQKALKNFYVAIKGLDTWIQKRTADPQPSKLTEVYESRKELNCQLDFRLKKMLKQLLPNESLEPDQRNSCKISSGQQKRIEQENSPTRANIYQDAQEKIEGETNDYSQVVKDIKEKNNDYSLYMEHFKRIIEEEEKEEFLTLKELDEKYYSCLEDQQKKIEEIIKNKQRLIKLYKKFDSYDGIRSGNQYVSLCNIIIIHENDLQNLKSDLEELKCVEVDNRLDIENTREFYTGIREALLTQYPEPTAGKLEKIRSDFAKIRGSFSDEEESLADCIEKLEEAFSSYDGLLKNYLIVERDEAWYSSIKKLKAQREYYQGKSYYLDSLLNRFDRFNLYHRMLEQTSRYLLREDDASDYDSDDQERQAQWRSVQRRRAASDSEGGEIIIELSSD